MFRGDLSGIRHSLENRMSVLFHGWAPCQAVVLHDGCQIPVGSRGNPGILLPVRRLTKRTLGLMPTCASWRTGRSTGSWRPRRRSCGPARRSQRFACIIGIICQWCYLLSVVTSPASLIRPYLMPPGFESFWCWRQTGRGLHAFPLGRCGRVDQAMSQGTQAEVERAAHVDVGECDRRDAIRSGSMTRPLRFRYTPTW